MDRYLRIIVCLFEMSFAREMTRVLISKCYLMYMHVPNNIQTGRCLPCQCFCGWLQLVLEVLVASAYVCRRRGGSY